jgi:hypothetical protein
MTKPAVSEICHCRGAERSVGAEIAGLMKRVGVVLP